MGFLASTVPDRVPVAHLRAARMGLKWNGVDGCVIGRWMDSREDPTFLVAGTVHNDDLLLMNASGQLQDDGQMVALNVL